MSTLNPYVNFRDEARAALAFYQSVLGGELTVSTFAEFGMNDMPESADLIMHGQLETPAGFTLMASDTPPSMTFDEGGRITISVSGREEDELRGYWDGLADGATVTMPLEKAPWGDSFGQLTDRFGVNWMFNIGSADSAE